MMEELILRLVVKIETKNPKSVEVYLKEILNQMSKNKHFSIIGYEMEIVKNG